MIWTLLFFYFEKVGIIRTVWPKVFCYLEIFIDFVLLPHFCFFYKSSTVERTNMCQVVMLLVLSFLVIVFFSELLICILVDKIMKVVWFAIALCHLIKLIIGVWAFTLLFPREIRWGVCRVPHSHLSNADSMGAAIFVLPKRLTKLPSCFGETPCIWFWLVLPLTPLICIWIWFESAV